MGNSTAMTNGSYDVVFVENTDCSFCSLTLLPQAARITKETEELKNKKEAASGGAGDAKKEGEQSRDGYVTKNGIEFQHEGCHVWSHVSSPIVSQQRSLFSLLLQPFDLCRASGLFHDARGTLGAF